MPKTASASTKTRRSKRPAAGKSRKPAKPPTSFPNYHGAVKFLTERINVERTRAQRVDQSIFKLERMERLMEAMGNPQSTLRFVHVAGTNGKGSTVAMLTSCLRKCGYTVGTYTSPHLVDVRERIAINDQPISHAHFTELMGRVADGCEALPKRLGQPTFFEVMTALAFLHYAEQAVDIAVIETGLGGRLDSTNIITPEVSVVTGIDFDHQVFLGDTLAKIATEKAGIFKPGASAITFKQDKEVLEALRTQAEKVGALFEVVGDDIEFSYRFEATPQLGPHMRVGLSTPRVMFEHVPVPLPGEHQAQNCGLVLAVIDKLMSRGFDLPDGKVIAGLSETQIPGRMELIANQPRILLDGAHNPSAVGALIKSIGAHIPYDSLVLVFGCSADKDVNGLLEKVALGGDKVVFTRAKGNPRAADPRDLQRRFVEISSKMCQVADSLPEALSIAGRAASRDDLVCITGSFYLVGEAKKLLQDRLNKAAAAEAAAVVEV